MNSIKIMYSNIEKTLPERIDFSLTLNRSAISNILLNLEIGTIKKNTYTVFTSLSNSNGIVTVTKSELFNQIDSVTKFAIMDYCGINNNFNGVIIASIPNKMDIQKSLDAYEQFSKYFEYERNHKENILVMQKAIEYIDINEINIEYDIFNKLN